MIFIIVEVTKTILDFSQGVVKVLKKISCKSVWS